MKSILIIDDDPLITKTLSSHLARQGFEIQEGGTRRGGDPANTKRPGVTWSFWTSALPDLDGIEVLRRLREKDKQSVCPDYDRLR